MMKPYLPTFFYAATILILAGCMQDKYPLPSPQSAPVSFGANDTSYIELQPIWDAAHLATPLSYPVDIVSGPDGLIFVADQNNNRIVTLSKAGIPVYDRGFDRLQGIARPCGLAIDSKLNLLIVNNSDTLYCWNQYLNSVDLDSVAVSGVFIDPQTGNPVELTWNQVVDRLLAGEAFPRIVRLNFSKDNDLIEQAIGIYPLFIDPNQSAAYAGVASGPHGAETLFVSDSYSDRIFRLRLVPRLVFLTKSGNTVVQYRAVFTGDIATYGSGAGTVDTPGALAGDRQGNLYFTQLDGNFLVQKLKAPDFSPQYVLYQHAIMDLERFSMPYDIALDDEGDIFVMDTGAGRVYKFDNSGKNAGQEIDLGDRGIATQIFTDARGIMATNKVVYVAESGKNRIRRFQYSVSDDDLPDDDKKP